MNSTLPDKTISRDSLADYLIHLSLNPSAQDDFRRNPGAALGRSGLSSAEQELFRGDSSTRLLLAFQGEDPMASIPTVVAVVVINATRCL